MTAQPEVVIIGQEEDDNCVAAPPLTRPLPEPIIKDDDCEEPE